MALIVHARIRKGKKVFRLWSTFSDSYCSPAVGRETMLNILLNKGILQLLQETNSRLDAASENGTSSMVEGPVQLETPWEKNIEKNTGFVAATPAQQEQRLRLKRVLKKFLGVLAD